ncbi:Methionine aminopeptidase [Mycolicibacterium thermoresistibile]|uniref:Methionine aminopeptidase n=1 Tax=Mycolicibacterium thermoresistibile TaxID=1797 RepID=A0A100XDF3_MYCTH|nr:Methionine aminopeptidase [Mycolicibacterium thermoresistibile]
MAPGMRSAAATASQVPGTQNRVCLAMGPSIRPGAALARVRFRFYSRSLRARAAVSAYSAMRMLRSRGSSEAFPEPPAVSTTDF